MHTNTSKLLVSSLAAGALVLGSATGAVAHGKAHPKPKPKPPAPYIQLTSVDVHRHSPVNVNAAAVTRSIHLRATVRDTVRTANPTSVSIVLAQYTKKRGTEVEPPVVADITEALTLKATNKRKKSKQYAAVITGAELKAALSGMPVGSAAYVCIKSAEVTAPAGVTVKADAKRVAVKENGGDCVRIINVDPAKTKTRTDDRRPHKKLR